MRTIDVNRRITTVGVGSTGTPVAGSTPQSAARSAAFAQPLAVTIKDAGGNPAQNVVVTYIVPGSGASATLSAPTAVTNHNGIASVTATANATAGGYVVTAGVTGLVVPAAFNLTNT
jgi:hypothetical protein